MNIVSWNITLTEHQVHLLRELKKKNLSNLVVVIKKKEIPERKNQGWIEPNSYDLNPQILGSHWLIEGIKIINKNKNALNLFSGLWASRSFFILLLYALLRGYKVGIIVESFSNINLGTYSDTNKFYNSILRILRPPCYWIAGFFLGKYIRPIFAISPKAVKQFTDARFLKENIYPFAYFIPINEYINRKILPGVNDSLRIVYLGGFIERKGINELIELAYLCNKQNLNIHFTIYGPGFVNKFVSIPPNVSLNGLIPFGSAQKILPNYDLLIVPSKYDGWGVVVNESLMQCVPVLVSNKVGASVLVEQSGAGLIFDLNNKDAQLKILKNLINNRGIIKEWSENARVFKNCVSPQKGASYMLECIDANLLRKLPPPCPWVLIDKTFLYAKKKKILKVVMHTRKPKQNNFSVEGAFREIRSNFPPEIECFVSESYFDSKGILRRVLNMFQAALYQGDINHVTGDVHFLTYLLSRKKTILTILDCVFMHNSRGLKRFMFKLLWGFIPEKRVTLITVISESTKNELLKVINCRPDKIRVIPVCISGIFKFHKKEFNIDKPKILHIGTSNNKNLIRLVYALQDINCELMIIGILSDEQRYILRDMKIDFINYFSLSEFEVFAKYCECDIVSFVSIYEGFGMPIIEANTVGRPVVTGNIYSMPEVAGDAACLVDPYNILEIRNAIKRIINDKTYREQLIIKGFINSRRFNSQDVTKEYLKIYQEVAESTL